MLDSLVRVSRRVLRVPETESSQTETRTVRDYTAATKQRRRAGVRTRAGRRRRRSACVGPDALGACAVRIEAYSVSIPSETPAGHRTGSTVSRERHRRTPGRRLGRRRTGRDALLREKCTPSTDVDGRGPCARRRVNAPYTSRHAPVRRRNDDESLRSFIRVSQVYP